MERGLTGGFFATPILYLRAICPSNLKSVIMLNLMARIISMLRDDTLYGSAPDLLSLTCFALSSLVLLFIGYAIFYHLGPKYAKVIEMAVEVEGIWKTFQILYESRVTHFETLPTFSDPTFMRPSSSGGLLASRRTRTNASACPATQSMRNVHLIL